MPILKNETSKRLMRWMLPHTAPALLSLEHPVQEDLAAGADEIERLTGVLETILMMHDGNQPAALGMPDLEYARRTIRNIHLEAHAALSRS